MTFVYVFERLLDCLDTSGGHIMILLVMVLVGIGIARLDLGSGVLEASFGALLYACKTAHSNHTRHGTAEPPKG